MGDAIWLLFLIVLLFAVAFTLTIFPSPKVSRYDMNLTKMLNWVAVKHVKENIGQHNYESLPKDIRLKKVRKNYSKIQKWYNSNSKAIVSDLQNRNIVTKDLMCNIEDTREMLYLMYLGTK